MNNLYDLSEKRSNTGKPMEFITAEKFFDLIQMALSMELTKREKDAFYLLLVTKFRRQNLFDIGEIEEVLYDMPEGKDFKRISTILRVKFHQISAKSKRFINRLNHHLEEKKCTLKEMF
jgi:hypothetical protein